MSTSGVGRHRSRPSQPQRGPTLRQRWRDAPPTLKRAYAVAAAATAAQLAIIWTIPDRSHMPEFVYHLGNMPWSAIVGARAAMEAGEAAARQGKNSTATALAIARSTAFRGFKLNGVLEWFGVAVNQGVDLLRHLSINLPYHLSGPDPVDALYGLGAALAGGVAVASGFAESTPAAGLESPTDQPQPSN